MHAALRVPVLGSPFVVHHHHHRSNQPMHSARSAGAAQRVLYNRIKWFSFLYIVLLPHAPTHTQACTHIDTLCRCWWRCRSLRCAEQSTTSFWARWNCLISGNDGGNGDEVIDNVSAQTEYAARSVGSVLTKIQHLSHTLAVSYRMSLN